MWALAVCYSNGQMPAGHIVGTCGRNTLDKDEKDREPNPKVSGPSPAKHLVASTLGSSSSTTAVTWLVWGARQPRGRRVLLIRPIELRTCASDLH